MAEPDLIVDFKDMPQVYMRRALHASARVCDAHILFMQIDQWDGSDIAAAYCLDAPRFMPAGSTIASFGKPRESRVLRGGEELTIHIWR